MKKNETVVLLQLSEAFFDDFGMVSKSKNNTSFLN